MDFRRAVKAGGGEGDARHIGLIYQIPKGDGAFADADAIRQENDFGRINHIMRGGKIGQAAFKRQRRRLCRLAIQIRAGGGGGGRGVGHLVRSCGGDFYPFNINLENFGDDLRHFDVKSLSHLGAAVIDHHTAIGIDMQQGPCLVHMCRGEGNAKFDWGQGNSLF